MRLSEYKRMLALSLSNVSNLGEAKLRLSESRAIQKPLSFGKAKLYFAFRSFIRNFAKENKIVVVIS